MNKSYRFNLQSFSESDGKLGIFETASVSGFNIKRIFYIFDVPKGQKRANHACMNSAIIFIAIAGSVQISVETEGVKTTYLLNNRETAVYVPPASWVCAYHFSEETVLLGLSDKCYQDCEYIDDYELYKSCWKGLIK